MTKSSLLKLIAHSGYNVGLGAKKHFATYDITIKAPMFFSLIVLIIGINKVAYLEFIYQKEASIFLIITGVLGLIINFYNFSKNDYNSAAIKLTKNFNDLHNLYSKVKGLDKTNFQSEKEELDQILKKFYSNAISNQIPLADWYAHFKFFYQMQTGWVSEELNLKFFKDKIPNSFKIFVTSTIIIIACFLCYKYLT